MTDEMVAYIQTLRNFRDPRLAWGSRETFQTFDDSKTGSIHPAHRNGTLAEMMSQLESWNKCGGAIHVTVNPTDGRGRSKDHITHCVGLWADLDNNKATVPIDLDRLPLRPTMAVASSKDGRHCYWLFPEALEATPEIVSRVEEALAGIAANYEDMGADSKVAEVARVLRVPGFVNNKPEHDGYRVSLLWKDGLRYSLDELEKAFPPVSKECSPVVEGPQVDPAEIAAVSMERRIEKGIRYAETCTPGIKGDGGNAAFHLVCKLFRFGLPSDQVYEIFRDYFNRRCTLENGVTPYLWSESEIRHKVEDGYKQIVLRENAFGADLLLEAKIRDSGETNGFLSFDRTEAATIALPPGVESLRVKPENILHPTASRNYTEHKGGMAWIRRKKDKRSESDSGEHCEVWSEELIPLCDYVPTIREEITWHVGESTKTVYRIDGVTDRGTHLKTLDVEESEFQEMKWVARWGAEVGINLGFPGKGIMSHIRMAIRERREFYPPVKRVVYDHIGWRKINDEDVYLHSGGGIGVRGLIPDLAVDPEIPSLRHYALPHPPNGNELAKCIQASFKILDVTGDAASVPLLLATYRSTFPLQADWGVHFHAETGAGKSTLVALSEGHFFTGATKNNLTASWTSTQAYLEATMHAGKNTIVCIDDANLSVSDVAKKMERLFRSQGNGVARGRMNATMTAQRSFSPRGLLISTGEDLPEGHSCRARVLLVETPSVVRKAGNALLDELQLDVKNGRMTGAMSAWLSWLAPRLREIESNWGESLTKMRQQVQASFAESHGRSVDLIAELLITAQHLLQWAREMNAITVEESNQYWTRFMCAFNSLAEDQREGQSAEDPITKFLWMIPELVAGGKCHLKNTEGSQPGLRHDAIQFGWTLTDTAGNYSWKSNGICIGTIHEGIIYLNKQTTVEVLNAAARAGGGSFNMSPGVFWKRVAKHLLPSDGRHAQRKIPGSSQRGMAIMVNTFPAWEDWRPQSLEEYARGAAPGLMPPKLNFSGFSLESKSSQAASEHLTALGRLMDSTG